MKAKVDKVFEIQPRRNYGLLFRKRRKKPQKIGSSFDEILREIQRLNAQLEREEKEDAG